MSDGPSPNTVQHPLLPNVRPILERGCRVAVWRLPSEVSQSRLGGRTEPSNACTLIALQLIELIERRNVHFVAPTAARLPLTAPPPLTRAAAAAAAATRAPAGAEPRARAEPGVATACASYLVGTFIEAMVEGNEAHERAIKSRRSTEHNFTIPDAISALHKRHTEIDFCSVSGSFNVQLPRFIRIALRSPSLLPLDRIHFVIIAFERTVLLVADRRTDSLILLDSHLHGSMIVPTTGATIAAAHFSELALLIQWMGDHIFPETKATNLAQEFEISTVAYAGATRDCAPPERTRMGGFDAYQRPQTTRPAVPQMRPTPIFTPQQDKENKPPQQEEELQPKKPSKRSADSAPRLGSKRACKGRDRAATASRSSSSVDSTVD